MAASENFAPSVPVRVPHSRPKSAPAAFSFGHVFEVEALAAAGDQRSILIRDATCRRFGDHGLTHGQTAFSFGHMFGF